MKPTTRTNLRSILPLTTAGDWSVRCSYASTPFGNILIASTEKGICSVSLAPDKGKALYVLMRIFPKASLLAERDPMHQEFLNVFEKEPADLRFHREGEPENLTFHLKGTPFQLDVWKALLDIPFGRTCTYGDIARIIGKPKAFRAVGSAVGSNPIFFAIPCHRVLPTTGGIGNYFWGAEVKRYLLNWEGGNF
jgi:AraC family transcriptional regulator, regulatory protein of adaptative response / methylated-DNA-[protein]-cysteine methyltransferase